jgi:endoglucanase
VRGNFTDIPIIVGEFGLEIHATEPAARWKWFDHVVRTGHKYNFAMMLWDASIHFVVNSTDPWQDPTALDILLNAAGDGPPNQLPDSTEDPNAVDQWSSAFMFHRVGKPVTDISLPFLWAPAEEPQILESIVSTTAEGSTTLWHTPNLDKEGNNMTFRTGYLDTIFMANGTPGVKAELLWHFSGGADLVTQAVQWDTPQPVGYATDFTVTPANVGSDLYVPIEYKGLAKLAAVKAVIYNSTYLFDPWTQWLGPLQQARLVSGILF